MYKMRPDPTETQEIFLPCCCNNEGLLVRHRKTCGSEYQFSYWSTGTGCSAYTWKQKLRFIWHLLRTGNPFTDMIVLEPSEAKHLAKFLANSFPPTSRDVPPPPEDENENK